MPMTRCTGILHITYPDIEARTVKPRTRGRMRAHYANAGLLALAVSLVGCGGEGAPGPDGPSRSLAPEEVMEQSLATWEVSDPSAVSPDDATLEVGVSRLGCANGETGEISDVDVDRGDDQIVVRASVEPLDGSSYNCLGNDVVKIEIDLGAPLGDRDLVDGACEHPRAARTTFCDSEVRWAADAQANT